MSEPQISAKDVLNEICANPSRFSRAAQIVTILGKPSSNKTILAKFDEDSVSIVREDTVYHITFNSINEITGFIAERLLPPDRTPETQQPPNQQ